MTEQATSTRQGAKETGGEGPADLREELARNREEILRLRDLLIGKDAELGTLRGRLAEMEAGTGRLLNAATRVRSLIPSFAWAAALRLRKRRGARG